MSVILDKINNLAVQNGKIALSHGEIYKAEKSLKLYFLCDFNMTNELSEMIRSLVKAEVPTSVETVEVNFEKIIADKNFVVESIRRYLSSSHKAIVDSIDYEKISVNKVGYMVTVLIPVGDMVREYISSKNIADEIEAELNNSFVEDFKVNVVGSGGNEVDNGADLTKGSRAAAIYHRERRTFEVDEVAKLFNDDSEKTCTYISDTKNFIGTAYVAGVITRIEERMTKAVDENTPGKPYFIIEINDRTASLTGRLFSTKTNLPKIQKLAVGSEIIARGDFAKRGDYVNFTYRSVNLCVFPKNFVPKEREKRPCPSEYSLIFPKPLEVDFQDNFLEVKTIPECFIGRTFVIFDLETTGIDFNDKITEIGAVKMIDGVVTEYFSTLVNPGIPIPKEVVDLTGITDDMVKDAPDFDEVCPDFYKFCYGATLVAHNIDFDSRFIKKQGEEVDFHFDNPLMDTLALARENIFGVSNYKLNTLCDKFGIVFRHHRAYSDAYATSQLFIEIIRIRGSLPF